MNSLKKNGRIQIFLLNFKKLKKKFLSVNHITCTSFLLVSEVLLIMAPGQGERHTRAQWIICIVLEVKQQVAEAEQLFRFDGTRLRLSC